MPRKGTKAAEIMRLYNMGGLSIQRIARIVGCREEYVRVVARQRNGTGMSDAERRYRASSLGKLHLQREAEKRRPGRLAYAKTLYRTKSHKAAREAYRKAQDGVHA